MRRQLVDVEARHDVGLEPRAQGRVEGPSSKRRRRRRERDHPERLWNGEQGHVDLLPQLREAPLRHESPTII